MGPRKINWREESMGFTLTLGNIYIKKKCYPNNVSFSFAYLNDIYVCFYYGCSLVVHHGTIENFLHKNYPIKYDDNTRAAYTDASNFHHCTNFCLEKRNKRASIEKIIT